MEEMRYLCESLTLRHSRCKDRWQSREQRQLPRGAVRGFVWAVGLS